MLITKFPNIYYAPDLDASQLATPIRVLSIRLRFDQSRRIIDYFPLWIQFYINVNLFKTVFRHYD